MIVGSDSIFHGLCFLLSTGRCSWNDFTNFTCDVLYYISRTGWIHNVLSYGHFSKTSLENESLRGQTLRRGRRHQQNAVITANRRAVPLLRTPSVSRPKTSVRPKTIGGHSAFHASLDSAGRARATRRSRFSIPNDSKRLQNDTPVLHCPPFLRVVCREYG